MTGTDLGEYETKLRQLVASLVAAIAIAKKQQKPIETIEELEEVCEEAKRLRMRLTALKNSR